jgi:hypothetical protein
MVETIKIKILKENVKYNGFELNNRRSFLFSLSQLEMCYKRVRVSKLPQCFK